MTPAKELFDLCRLLVKETPYMVKKSRELIEKHRLDVKVLVDMGGNTPLVHAACNGHAGLCALFIEKGADVNTPMSHDDHRPLYLAANNGHVGVCKLLITHGADIHWLHKEYGRRPMDFPACKEALAQLEREAWLAPMEPDQRMVAAAQAGNNAHLEKALEDGADIHDKGDLPLIMACGFGRTETVRLLLEKGANIHASNDMAMTVAINGGHSDTVKLLKQWAAAPKRDIPPTPFEKSIGHVRSVRSKLSGMERNEDELGRTPGGR